MVLETCGKEKLTSWRMNKRRIEVKRKQDDQINLEYTERKRVQQSIISSDLLFLCNCWFKSTFLNYPLIELSSLKWSHHSKSPGIMEKNLNIRRCECGYNFQCNSYLVVNYFFIVERLILIYFWIKIWHLGIQCDMILIYLCICIYFGIYTIF